MARPAYALGTMSRNPLLRAPEWHEEWPRPLVVGICVLPVLTGVAGLAQRGSLTDPDAATLFVALAVSPWLLMLVGVFLPRWLFAGIVLAGTWSAIFIPAHAPEDTTPFLLVFLAIEMAVITTMTESLIYAGLALGVVAYFDAFAHHAEALPWYLGVSLGWAGGYMVRAQYELTAELKAAQAGLAERAAADERQRIARELHDVIAHSMTVMMLHITGARRALERDPADAAKALEDAEKLGRQSLTDVRQVVGVLSHQGEAERAPLPDAGDIEKLVGSLSSAGAAVTLDIRGDIHSIPPTIGLALYRIVQESLTNAAKHAPGSPAHVSVYAFNGEAKVQVKSDHVEANEQTPNGGLGLLGMKERAEVLGGTFRAGPEGGKWIVTATVPTHGVPR